MGTTTVVFSAAKFVDAFDGTHMHLQEMGAKVSPGECNTFVRDLGKSWLLFVCGEGEYLESQTDEPHTSICATNCVVTFGGRGIVVFSRESCQ